MESQYLTIKQNGDGDLDLTVTPPPHKGVLTLSDAWGLLAEIEATTPIIVRRPSVLKHGKKYETPRKVFVEWKATV